MEGEPKKAAAARRVSRGQAIIFSLGAAVRRGECARRRCFFLKRCYRAAAAVGGRVFGGRASVFSWAVFFLVACAGSWASRFFLAGAFLRPGGEVGSILGFFWRSSRRTRPGYTTATSGLALLRAPIGAP